MNDITQLHLHVGQEIGVSPWFEIGQERINQFASAIVDPQWIHIDPERARRESPYGGTIAHGFLTLSLLSHLLESTVDVSRMKMGVNYGLNRVRFTDAVPAGSRIRGALRSDQIRKHQGWEPTHLGRDRGARGIGQAGLRGGVGDAAVRLTAKNPALRARGRACGADPGLPERTLT